MTPAVYKAKVHSEKMWRRDKKKHVPFKRTKKHTSIGQILLSIVLFIFNLQNEH